jgi:hypothetical protein
MSDNPFDIAIYTKAFQRVGWVNDPLELVVTPRHNQIGTATITVPTTHHRVPALVVEGARVWIHYQGDHLMSGPVRLVSGQGPTIDGTLTFQVEDDLRLLWRILGWPVPGAAYTAQGVKDDQRTGPAETVAKAYITANAVNRLGLPVTVAANLARGDSISVAMRMSVLADKLLPAIDTAGIGLSVRQSGAGLLVDAYAPSVYPQVLTEASGVVQSWSLSRTAFGASRTVAGGSGVGVGREFRLMPPGTGFNALELLWGDVVEVFTDANDVGSDYNQAVDNVASTKADRNEKDVARNQTAGLVRALLRAKNAAASALDVAIYNLAQHPTDTDAQTAKDNAQTRYNDTVTDYNQAVTENTAAQAAFTTAQAAYTAALAAAAAALPAYYAELDGRGQQTLDDARTKSGLSVELSETANFQYGRAIRVGDQVSIELAAQVDTPPDVLREATLTWNADSGLVAKPTVGDRSDDPDKRYVRLLSQLVKSVRTLKTR